MRDLADELAAAVYNTVRYFDLFDQPVTATQIWRSLLVPQTTAVRWGGRRGWHLQEVQEVLAGSAWLQERLGQRWGYYFLTGREALVSRWQQRHRLAQQKWKTTRRVARWLVRVPLVRMVAMSGSLAAANTRPGSDLDLFVVVAARRIWTARLLLLAVAELTGRRRRYWDEEAPDKICLNHYLTDDSLAVDPEIRNVYTALLYRQLIPLAGLPTYQQFAAANATWMKRFVMYPETPVVASRHLLAAGRWAAGWQRFWEAVFREPSFDWLERWAESLQRRSIRRHTKPGQAGRVVLSDRELAFHPDTKVPGILERFAQEEGQGQLL